MSKVPLFPVGAGGLKSYLKACNMDLRDGSIKPSPRMMASFDDYAADGVSGGEPAPTIVYWAWTSAGTTVSVGSPWAGKYKYIWYFRRGLWAKGDHDCGAQITDLCAFEDGSGNARVIVCYGTNDYIDVADGLSDLTASVTATGVKLLYGIMAGPDVYGVGNRTGDTVAYSTYKITKCPAGNNPLLGTNWGTSLPVGSPVWAINSLRAIGAAPIVGKPEGLYILNEVTNRYENLLNYQEFSAHPDNGKGMFNIKDGVCYPTANGSLFHFDGYRVKDIGPHRYSIEHRDNPHTRARITAGCDTGAWVLAATAPCESNWTQGQGLKIQTLDGSTYADITTNCTDGNYGVGGSVAALGNGDYIYVGANVPFEAVYFRMGVVNTDAAPYFDRPQYCSNATGPVWTDIGPAASYAPDGTRNGGKMLAKSGYITWRNFFTAHTSMKTVAVNSITRYWVRFPIVSAGNAISAGTFISEAYIIPSRPAISSTAALAYTGPDAAGRFAHILAGRPSGSEWEWHDLFCVPVHAPIVAMSYFASDCGSAEKNEGPRLAMITQFDNIVALMPQTSLPGSPVNENYVDGMTFGTPTVFLAPNELSDSDTDRSTIRKEIEHFHVYGDYVDGSDTMTMLSRWDHNAWDTAQAVNTAPVRIKGPEGVAGLVLETALAYEDVDVELAGPRITQVHAEFRDTAIPFDQPVQGDAITPETE